MNHKMFNTPTLMLKLSFMASMICCFILIVNETFSSNHRRSIPRSNNPTESLNVVSPHPIVYRYSPTKMLLCIQAIRNKAFDRIKDILTDPKVKRGRALFVDPAQQGNVGDTLLVEGTRRLAIAFGWGETTLDECSVAQSRSSLPCVDAVAQNHTYSVAFWQAGGNWGDLWHGIQKGRIESLKYLLDAGLTVVCMPQSFHYRDPENRELDLIRMKEILQSSIGDLDKSRERLIFLWRQEDSFKAASKLYTFADNRVVPDVAFWTGPHIPHNSVTERSHENVDVMLILRNDVESTLTDQDRSEENVRELLDTISPGKTITFKVTDWKDMRLMRGGFHSTPEYSLKIESGVRLLSSGTVVITDKMHGSVLSFLSLKPVFYIDQSYGKIKGVWNGATAGLEECSDERAMRVFPTTGLKDSLFQAVRYLGYCKETEEC
jgi:exopolysaccharide biosynthesis predicted pyruvyltransferase EpsI